MKLFWFLERWLKDEWPMPKSGSFDSFSACTRRFSGLEIGWLRLVVGVSVVHVGSDFIMWAHTLLGGLGV